MTLAIITDDGKGNMIKEDIKSFWYIGQVATNKEKRCKEVLEKLSYQVYLPTQEVHIESPQGRKRTINRLIIPGYIFVHCTEEQRVRIFSDPLILAHVKPYLSRWMVNKASKVSQFGKHSIATVPDSEMQQFIRVVEKSQNPVTFEAARLRKGDRIRIIKGELEGCIGELETLPNRATKLVIRIAYLGDAKVEIDEHSIELLPPH